ncbi:Protein CBG27758 [Caenorhabditis briggsae]|uniref:Protein CBG27758 n=1 Tax=Caenorhabditis briggsae TaxID=6238 RepID=B6IFY2_CAEBR|nr:Protein CBG27758 [Caenorhabditis briggsae]CAR98812.1 Protein CBG27758 [Caenorhabditis briggsae]
MADVSTECCLYYPNQCSRIFDDIMSTFEETLVPLEVVPDFEGLFEQKLRRIKMAELLKEPTVRGILDNLKSAREATEKKICIEMAADVNEGWNSTDDASTSSESDSEVVKLMKEMHIDKRAARALSPLDTYIPNFNLERTMFEWGTGGPSSKQYELMSYIVKLKRKAARTWFLERASCYKAFRGNQMSWTHSDEDVMNGFELNKREEDFLIASFLPNEGSVIASDKHCHVDGPSLGKAFLGLDFLTKRNEAFKAFVAKTMAIDPLIRERLASNYLYKRMIEVSSLFHTTKELKYNYIRIAWERKFSHMDDYVICLILFIRDKTTNITWEEVEEIIYPKAKEIIRAGFKLSFDSELKNLDQIRADVPKSC